MSRLGRSIAAPKRKFTMHVSGPFQAGLSRESRRLTSIRTTAGHKTYAETMKPSTEIPRHPPRASGNLRPVNKRRTAARDVHRSQTLSVDEQAEPSETPSPDPPARHTRNKRQRIGPRPDRSWTNSFDHRENSPSDDESRPGNTPTQSNISHIGHGKRTKDAPHAHQSATTSPNREQTEEGPLETTADTAGSKNAAISPYQYNDKLQEIVNLIQHLEQAVPCDRFQEIRRDIPMEWYSQKENTDHVLKRLRLLAQIFPAEGTNPR